MTIDANIVTKAQGALIAAAFGDAMGWPHEDRSHRVRSGGEAGGGGVPALIKWARRVGPRFQPLEETVNRGEYSDDTQLLLATTRALLSGQDWWQHLARVELPTWLLYERGGGRATKNAAESWLFGRPPWKQSKVERRVAYFSAGGNGVAMRILPHALWGASRQSFDTIAHSTVADGILTHGHPRALIGALSYSYAAWWAARHTGTLGYGELIDAVLSGVSAWSTPPAVDTLAPDWARSTEGDKGKSYERTWSDTVSEMNELLALAARGIAQGALAVDRQVMSELGCFSREMKGAGTTASAAAIFLASRYASDPVKGIAEAAFAAGADTDTVASMTGGLLGLLCGTQWLDNRTRDLQDVDYIAEVAALLGTGKAVSSVEERYRRANPVTPTKNARMFAALAEPSATSIPLPDERTARIISTTETATTGKVSVLWKLALSDGQTVHIRKLRTALSPASRTATLSSESARHSARSADEAPRLDPTARVSTTLRTPETMRGGPDSPTRAGTNDIPVAGDTRRRPPAPHPQLAIPLEDDARAGTIGLHPEAMRRFSQLADEVRASLRPAKPATPSSTMRGSRAHRPLKREIRLGIDTGDSPWTKAAVDQVSGRYLHLEIHSPQFHLELSPSGIEALGNLIDSVFRHDALHDRCSLKYIGSSVIKWLQDSQVSSGSRPWGEVIAESLRRDVTLQRILVPLDGIAIDTAFSVGAVSFGFFTREYLEQMYRRVESRGGTEQEVGILRTKYERYAGVVYAAVESVAEPERAKQLSIDHVERVLALLRFFHPAVLDVRAHCPLGRTGGLNPHLAHFFVEREGHLAQTIHEVSRWGLDMELSGTQVPQLIRDGLTRVDQLLSASTRTDLQERVLHAMVLFSAGVLSVDAEHRLIHALVAVESLLLKSPNEPILGSLAPRVAHVAAGTVEERRNIVADLRKVYDVRSSFVHHGVQADQSHIELINRAIRHCWSAVLSLLGEGRWTTKRDLIQALDDRLLM